MTADPTSLITLACPHCEAVNRMPVDRLAAQPACGKCGGRLFAGEPFELDDSGLERHLRHNAVPLLVDFWAPWCGPCRMMAPVLAQMAGTVEPKVRIAKVNTDVAQVMAGQLNIRSIPTLILFHHGREIARQAGAMPGQQLLAWLRQALGE